MKNLLIILILFLTFSCVSYKKCKEKFGNQTPKQDTLVYTTFEKLIIPHDSIVYSYVNDTNFINWLPPIKIGRARLSIKKTADSTFIRADCDSVSTIVTNKYFKIFRTTTQFGVSPHWRIAFFVLSGVFVLLLLCIAIKYFFTKRKENERPAS